MRGVRVRMEGKPRIKDGLTEHVVGDKHAEEMHRLRHEEGDMLGPQAVRGQCRGIFPHGVVLRAGRLGRSKRG